jgi:hypothetical protein
MDLRLRFLDSFLANGSDGRMHKVRAFDRLTRDQSLPSGSEHWESTGVVEYRLDDGRLVEVLRDGSLRIAGSGVTLTPETDEMAVDRAERV